jgi:type VI secretion system secreted protein Hcp
MNINPTFSRTLALVAPVTALTLSHAGAAAVDYFLKLDGIKGESVDEKHKGEIDILSFSWGVNNIGSITGGGGAGKASFKEFTVTKKVDRSSPKLMLACATGERLPQMQFAVAREPSANDPEGGAYYIITLSDILISSYQSGGTQSDPVPTESVSFNFSKITFEYRPADGSEAVIETAEIVRDPTGNP